MMSMEAMVHQLENETKGLPATTVRVKKYEQVLLDYSRRIWCFFGHTGKLTPWHDQSDAVSMLYHQERKRVIDRLIRFLAREDISMEAYAVFALPFFEPKEYVSPGRIYSGVKSYPKSWIMKLRKHVGSCEALDLLASLVMRFYELQVEYYGVADFNYAKYVQRDFRTNVKGRGKCFEMYHILAERMMSLQVQGIDPMVWLETKFKMAYDFLKEKPGNSKIGLTIIVNANGLEPHDRVLKGFTDDPYREIKEFLGLSPECQFTDGYIPKGWKPSDDDRDSLKRVVRITGLGYYYYPDGTQRRGLRHYAQNSYMAIKCLPENFEIFKDEWLDPRLILALPTWEEYSKWAVHAGWWAEDGSSVNGRGRPVKWRKNGRK